MINLTTETFKTEIQGHKGLALVDFYTTSCGPCRTIAPVFAKSAEKHTQVKHAKIEPTDATEVFVDFSVNYVPTFILFKDGKEIDRKGFISEKDLEAWLTENQKPSGETVSEVTKSEMATSSSSKDSTKN